MNHGQFLSCRFRYLRVSHCWRWHCRFAEWFTHFNLAVAHASFETRLWVYSRSIQHSAVLQCESRVVPGTLNAVAHKIAFRERSAEMRARFGQGKDPGSSADQQDRDAIVFGALRLCLCQLGFREHRHKVGRKSLASGTINAHSVLVNHLPAQTGSHGHYAITQRTQDPTHSP